MYFDFSRFSPLERYKLLSSTVTPRPIAWVSTIDATGKPNAAPFSFFNVFAEDPATLGFAINHRSDTDRKDTGENVRLQREFVVNLVSADLVEKMNVTAIEFGPDIDEFAEAGLTPAASTTIRTPRIAESRVSFECRLMQVVALGTRRSLVLGEVLAMHVRDDAVLDAERCWIDTQKLQLVGRMQGHQYLRTADVFELPMIPVDVWNAKTGDR
ncbi:flavin reductase family protein [Paraburkholderia caballeronis]|uniref:NADH-FMN oxidoreductase RutF, flavin reductase (DIM6/NTAB) family n=1 Tax=Paraburkholderia caballeronis TaxID=416943 RepID=A0A1H7WBM8_9BURK|nr:flavin reductase family protein [Paraburkholderia caballeronis]PXW25024.1 flavin reductase (DIM6/NTAB) family NADH-FMN oxidoreductase RutF [Paraburkholderia caballeronis]PXW92810.1 flavin reductase (DIM6/NTAB) family NADH-FMN oxidoreductase RutF [Paraburkholderia caballeronis]RAJ86612.1 flavin reductase (DIM6/NTAB) family NADH-FMN oxidoreductase RutF [Paraburkholderia caballeronis]SEE73446.1 NADH-FMN oxidoreductase RutF, flavin reductase (DIM6/NTAB) family [Paraburkholderia caballeronis]SEM